MPNHKPIKERLQRMVMDGLDISTIQDDSEKAELAKEFLATRRFYAKAAIIIVSLICITLTLGFMIFGYQVKSEVISSCQAACQTTNSIMKEATAHECICIEQQGER